MGVGVDKLLLCPLVKRKIHRAVAIEWTDITNSAALFDGCPAQSYMLMHNILKSPV